MCSDVFLRELIESAATLYSIQRVHGDEVRQQTEVGYRKLTKALVLITGVLASCLLRINIRCGSAA